MLLVKTYGCDAKGFQETADDPLVWRVKVWARSSTGKNVIQQWYAERQDRKTALRDCESWMNKMDTLLHHKRKAKK